MSWTCRLLFLCGPVLVVQADRPNPLAARTGAERTLEFGGSGPAPEGPNLFLHIFGDDLYLIADDCFILSHGISSCWSKTLASNLNLLELFVPSCRNFTLDGPPPMFVGHTLVHFEFAGPPKGPL